MKKTFRGVRIEKIKSILSQPQNMFVCLAGIFGFLFVFIVPPMQSPDEVEHLYRAYQVSQFNIKADPSGAGYGGKLPISIVQSAQEFKGTVAGHPDQHFPKSLLFKAGMKPLEPEKQQDIRFDNTAIYSPIPYMPQALGIGVARIFRADPLVIIYFGRIANLVVWILLLFFAIRTTPIGKWAFVVIALNPVSLFLASTLSSDAATTGLIALFIAIIVRFCIVPTKPTNRQLFAIALLPILICLTKNAYIPIVLLILFLPSQVVTWRSKLVIIMIALIIGLGWNLMILHIAQGIPAYFGIPGNIRGSAQISSIIHHPVHFGAVVLNNVLGQPGSAVLPSYDGVFGWLDTPNPYWLDILFFVSLVLALFYDDDESRKLTKFITPKMRITFLLIMAASIIALLSTLYVGYSVVASDLIQGVQGRYFIPLTFLLVPVVATTAISIKANKRLFVYILVTMMLVTLLGTTLTIAGRFY